MPHYLWQASNLYCRVVKVYSLLVNRLLRKLPKATYGLNWVRLFNCKYTSYTCWIPYMGWRAINNVDSWNLKHVYQRSYLRFLHNTLNKHDVINTICKMMKQHMFWTNFICFKQSISTEKRRYLIFHIYLSHNVHLGFLYKLYSVWNVHQLMMLQTIPETVNILYNAKKYVLFTAQITTQDVFKIPAYYYMKQLGFISFIFKVLGLSLHWQ